MEHKKRPANLKKKKKGKVPKHEATERSSRPSLPKPKDPDIRVRKAEKEGGRRRGGEGRRSALCLLVEKGKIDLHTDETLKAVERKEEKLRRGSYRKAA